MRTVIEIVAVVIVQRDTERIDASYDAGVLTLRIPVAEQAKPRRIQISGGGTGPRQLDR